MSATTEQRNHAVREFVGRLGYDDGHIRANFPVWMSDEVQLVDLAVFTHARPAAQDITTAAMACVVENGVPAGQRAIGLARELAAPTALIASAHGLIVWSVGPESVEPVSEVAYSDLAPGAADLRRWLAPGAVLTAKQIDAQMSLFSRDVSTLLTRARASSASRLKARLELAVDQAITGLRGLVMPGNELDRASRLIVGAIAALMISDKLSVGRPAGASQILADALDRFPQYFAWLDELGPGERQLCESVVAELGRDITYAGLDPAVVSHVYEQTLVTQASRRALGIYYTPPDLAQAMLAHLPVEDLSPDRRSVLDPACGSGSLLLASYDRLRQLAPSGLDLVERHAHASAHLRGLDSDPFAVQIAGLALLLNALPQGNGWQVTAQDILAGSSGVADIVVSNPPWRQKGKGVPQLAERFITTTIDMLAPDGLLALVLPASWLGAKSMAFSRAQLRENCDVFEVWRLPEDTFPDAEMAPGVVFARRRNTQGHYVFRRAMRRSGWQERFFTAQSSADLVRLAHDNGLADDSLLYGPLDDDRETLRRLPTLRTALNDLARGPVPTPPVSQRGGTGQFPWLRDQRGLPALTEVPKTRLKPIRYPDEFNYQSDNGEQFASPKIFVSAIRKADNPWRLKVLIDRDGGIIPRESLFWLVPRSGIQLEALAALLSSAVASAWVDTLNPSRTIETSILTEFPIPASARAWQELAAVGRNVTARAAASCLGPADMRALDDLVFQLYNLSSATRARLKAHFAGFKAPAGGVRYPNSVLVPSPSGGTDTTRHYGAVMDIDDEAVRLWVPGLTTDAGDWMPLPSRFLGGHAWAGATFEAIVPDGDLQHAIYEFQPEGYLEIEDFTVDRR